MTGARGWGTDRTDRLGVWAWHSAVAAIKPKLKPSRNVSRERENDIMRCSSEKDGHGTARRQPFCPFWDASPRQPRGQTRQSV
jgi:hypothetical protein